MTDAQYDVVVVGSGVAGALVAYRVASNGKRVLVLEAGATVDRDAAVAAYAAAPVKNGFKALGAAYAEFSAEGPENAAATGYYVQTTDRAFKSTYERVLGGSTWHWLGHTPRLLPSDFALHTLYGRGVDWPMSYAELEPWYVEAERELGVAGDDDEWNGVLGAFRSEPFPMGKIWPSVADRHVADALRDRQIDGMTLRVRSTPSARNSTAYDRRPACAGNSTCVPLCPIGAKYDASVHVRKARERNVEFRERSVVTALVADESGCITAVEYRRSGAPHAERVRGRIVVLALHAIEVARLLLLSSLGNRSGQVGRNLMDHPQRAMLGLAREPVYPFRGPPATSGIEEFRDGPFRATHAAFRFSVGNDGWSRSGSPLTDLHAAVHDDRLFGAELFERLRERTSRQLRISCSTEMLPDADNRVTVPPGGPRDDMGLPRPALRFTVDAYTTDALDRAMDIAHRIYEAARATVPTLPDPNGFSGAGHIMGTTRAGNDPAASVVDADLRSHDHPNLFVVGASVFPTSGTANPTLTVAALALRASAKIDAHLGSA